MNRLALMAAFIFAKLGKPEVKAMAAARKAPTMLNRGVMKAFALAHRGVGAGACFAAGIGTGQSALAR